MTDDAGQGAPAAGTKSTAGDAAAATATTPAFPHPDAAKKVEEVANKAAAEVEAKALPVRQWLEQHMVPTIYQGMMAAAKERPDDPIEFLAAYLMEHNPKKKQKVEKDAS
jgi:protein dpy-30